MISINKLTIRLLGAATLFCLALLMPLAFMGALTSPRALEALALLHLTTHGATGLSIVISVFAAIVLLRKPSGEITRLERLGFLALYCLGTVLVLVCLTDLISRINT